MEEDIFNREKNERKTKEEVKGKGDREDKIQEIQKFPFTLGRVWIFRFEFR